MADFASMLKMLRERENLSQRELAARLNMSPSAIGMYESGKRRPKYEDEEAIADFFNVDLNTLRGKRTIEIDEAKQKLIDAYIQSAKNREILDLYHNAPADVQAAVEVLLKSAQPKSDNLH